MKDTDRVYGRKGDAERSLRRMFVLVAFMGVMAGCEDFELEVIRDIEVTPPVMTVLVGEERDVRAVALGDGGQPISIDDVEDQFGPYMWESADPGIAAVGGSVTFDRQASIRSVLGVTDGFTRVFAEVGGERGEVQVRVTFNRSCSRDVPLLQPLSDVLTDARICLTNTDDLYRGPYRHSAGPGFSPDQQPQSDHTGLDVVGGIVTDAPPTQAFFDQYPPGSTAEGYLALAGTDSWPAGVPALVLYIRTLLPVPLNADQFLEYAFVLNTARDLASGASPTAQFPNHWAQLGDFIYSALFFPGQGWTVGSVDISNGLDQAQPVSSAARVLIGGSTVVMVVPWEGPPEGPFVRATTFEHPGDFGQGGAWSGAYSPDHDELLDLSPLLNGS